MDKEFNKKLIDWKEASTDELWYTFHEVRRVLKGRLTIVI